LHYAEEKNHQEVVGKLIEAGANRNLKNRNDKTYLNIKRCS
jgi:ankyrin repeat protein